MYLKRDERDALDVRENVWIQPANVITVPGDCCVTSRWVQDKIWKRASYIYDTSGFDACHSERKDLKLFSKEFSRHLNVARLVRE